MRFQGETVRKRNTSAPADEVARRQLEITADLLYGFVETHFVLNGDHQEGEDWECVCSCRHQNNCSIFQHDPKVIAVLQKKDRPPSPPPILNIRFIAFTLTLAVLLLIVGCMDYLSDLFVLAGLPLVGLSCFYTFNYMLQIRIRRAN